MKSFQAVIQDPLGLHARPAALVVQSANKYQSKVSIKGASGATANLKSLINLLSLGVKQGDKVEVIAEGDDEADAISGIEKSLKESKII